MKTISFKDYVRGRGRGFVFKLIIFVVALFALMSAITAQTTFNISGGINRLHNDYSTPYTQSMGAVELTHQLHYDIWHVTPAIGFEVMNYKWKNSTVEQVWNADRAYIGASVESGSEIFKIGLMGKYKRSFKDRPTHPDLISLAPTLRIRPCQLFDVILRSEFSIAIGKNDDNLDLSQTNSRGIEIAAFKATRDWNWTPNVTIAIPLKRRAPIVKNPTRIEDTQPISEPRVLYMRNRMLSDSTFGQSLIRLIDSRINERDRTKNK